jgi:hypothetical protein
MRLRVPRAVAPARVPLARRRINCGVSWSADAGIALPGRRRQLGRRSRHHRALAVPLWPTYRRTASACGTRTANVTGEQLRRPAADQLTAATVDGHDRCSRPCGRCTSVGSEAGPRQSRDSPPFVRWPHVVARRHATALVQAGSQISATGRFGHSVQTATLPGPGQRRQPPRLPMRWRSPAPPPGNRVAWRDAAHERQSSWPAAASARLGPSLAVSALARRSRGPGDRGAKALVSAICLSSSEARPATQGQTHNQQKRLVGWSSMADL